jgi:hypothetical protein
VAVWRSGELLSSATDFDKLFWLHDGHRRGALRAKPRAWVRDQLAVLVGRESVTKPLDCDQFLGKTPYDLVGTGFAAFHLISDRVVASLRGEGFTGWRSYPAAVHTKGGEVISGYQGLVVTGKCVPTDPTAAREALAPPPNRRGQSTLVRQGLYFDPATWDGSDLFVPEGTGWIIVMEPVKEALTRARVTNIGFGRLTEIEQMVL